MVTKIIEHQDVLIDVLLDFVVFILVLGAYILIYLLVFYVADIDVHIVYLVLQDMLYALTKRC